MEDDQPQLPLPMLVTHPSLAASPTPAPAPILAIDRCMLRSPSRESVTTELSVSSQVSDHSRAIRFLNFNPNRSVSPNQDTDKPIINRPAGIPELEWCDEENDVIRSCAALSAILGLQKSFSTSDITQISDHADALSPESLRTAVSELTLSPAQKNSYLLCQSKLENTSRSCSTWVAVGDAATSQLPSPHGGHPSSAYSQHLTTLTPADLLRSVNKKVRQNYIRRKLLTTYKALERFSLSKCNLDTLGLAAAAAAATAVVKTKKNGEQGLGSGQASGAYLSVPGSVSHRTHSQSGLNTILKAVNKNKTLTVNDVERERGKPLSKYDRNIMIFNWLHALEPEEVHGEPTL